MTSSNLKRVEYIDDSCPRSENVFWNAKRGEFGLVGELRTCTNRKPSPQGRARFEVLQVKEQSASVQVYLSQVGVEDDVVDLQTDAAHGMFVARRDGPRMIERMRFVVLEAENSSATTCQRCGASRRRLAHGVWVVALCTKHEEGQQSCSY